MSRKPLIGTSWKMNKTNEETRGYINLLLPQLAAFDLKQIDAFLLPPFTSLAAASKLLTASGVAVGAQNMHWEASGAWTGEISPPMLTEFGCRYVELGHSERRYHFNETDERVNQKALAALRHDLRPIICIGETADEKAAGRAHDEVQTQIKIALDSVPTSQLSEVILAYEPRWAIGGAQAASLDDIHSMHMHLRHWLAVQFGDEQAASIRIIYGGSVNLGNAAGIIALDGVDGLFVGRAALDPDGFAKLVQTVFDWVRS